MDAAGYYNYGIEEIRSRDFPALKDITYVDHAGATLYAKSQISSVQQDLVSNVYGNPHSASPSSRLTTDSIDQIRFRILKFFNASPEEYSVVFTSGCTGALKLVAESFSFSKHPPKSDTSKIQSNSQSPVPADNRNATFEADNSLRASKGEDPQGRGSKGNNHAGLEKKSQLDDNSQPDSGDRKSESGSDQKKPTGSNFVSLENARNPVEKSGYFCYLQDNHTSVQGMRELAFERCSAVLCLTEEEVLTGCTEESLVSGSFTAGNAPLGNCLFVFPGQSNFSGRKYPLEWIGAAHQGELGFQKELPERWMVVLDAASLVSTSPLDFGRYKPDFATLSFYKIFGFPTGIGALLVRNSSAWVLERRYFGGGTVAASTARQRFCALRPNISERFEDGTLPYLDIIALRHGFDTLENLAGGMETISQHTFLIAQYFARNLSRLRHDNGAVLAQIYAADDFGDRTTQGAIVNFSLRRSNGDYIGFAEVDKLAQLHEIHVRTGCFCNIGACQLYLGISSDTIKENLNAGHVCGDDKDLINGRPTGSVRISFGYMSSLSDATRCLHFVAECFLESSKTSRPALSAPEWWNPPKEVGGKKTAAVAVAHDLGIHGPGSDRQEERKRNEAGLEVKGEKAGQKGENRGVERKESDEIVCSEKHRKLTDLYLYPIKSAGTFRVSEWEIGDRGFLYDRTWMVVTENGVALGQKREPKLCLLRPVIHLDRGTMELTFPDVASFHVPLDAGDVEDVSDVSVCTNKICNDRVNTGDCGDDVATWLCNTLERPGLRLLRQLDQDKRQTKRKDIGSHSTGTSTPAGLSLANESQFLLISRESVRSLQKKLGEAQEDSQAEDKEGVTKTDVIDEENLVQRFRANLVIDGGLPFDEDGWTGVACGDVQLTCQGQCSRCGMVCLDQNTGEKTSEPLRTLAAWRGGKVYFGAYLRATNSGGRQVLKVGSPVTVA